MTYTATYSPKTTSSASIPSPGSPGRLRRSQEARLYQGTKTGAICCSEWGPQSAKTAGEKQPASSSDSANLAGTPRNTPIDMCA